MRPIIGSGGGSGWPEVNYYADLPASPALNDIYAVLNSSGIWPINYHASGIYRWNGVSWVKFDDLQELLKNVTLTDVSANKLIGSDGTKVQEVTIGTGLSLVGNTIENTNPSPTPPGGDNLNIQFNNNGSFGGAQFLNYDPNTGITSLGKVDNSKTEFGPDGWQTMYKDARPYIEVRGHLVDKREDCFRWVPEFAGSHSIGYWEIAPKEFDSKRIDFNMEIPHEYEEFSDYELHIHFSNCDDVKERDEVITWRVEYVWANVNKQDNPAPDSDNFISNGVRTCFPRRTVRAIGAWTHLKTDTEGEGVMIRLRDGKISHWLQGCISVYGRGTTYTGKLCFLGIDLHIITDTLGSRDPRAKTLFGTPLKIPTGGEATVK